MEASSVYAALIVAFGAFAYKDNRLGIKVPSPKVWQNPGFRRSDTSRPTTHFFILGPPVETGFSIHIQ